MAEPSEAKTQDVVDVWNVATPESNEKAWEERTGPEKAIFVAIQAGKALCVVGVLYLFILSLDLMGSAFKIIGGPSAGAVFRNQEIFDNPIAGLVLGILATVLVQSSSTSTSIIISMTASGLMEVKNSIPMIMGANIGTSVTNTIVSIGQIGNRNEYRRAFAGATVHDCFNLLSVAVLLPVEIITGFLMHLSKGLVDAFGIKDDQDKGSSVDFLKVVTKPVTSRLVQVDKKLVTSVAKEKDAKALDKLMKSSMIVNKQSTSAHFFMDTPMDDTAAGWLLLVVSLILLCNCLILLVTTLQSIFRGRAAIWMKSLLNLEIKSVPFVGDYILIAFGAGITILMQSSSITTSTLTPLVGVGLIKLEKMYPFTIGANVGTTVTGILSALAGSNIATGMQVALSHLCFNLVGMLLWFPIPIVRRVPLSMARFLGNMAADLRWFPFAYIAAVFGVLPAILFLLSLAGVAAVAVVGCIMFLSLLGLIALIALRLNRPQALPRSLAGNPSWLPPTLRTQGSMEGAEGGADAQVQEAAVSTADVNKANWWQGPFAWGSGWFVLVMLVMAVPNNQWGIVKYTTFDGREHVGIGAWSSCSKHFQHDVEYMPAPSNCNSTTLNGCFWNLSKACAADGFSSQSSANGKYESSWASCRDKCTVQQWHDGCTSWPCSGSSHAEQCRNVSSAVKATFQVTYVTGVAWAEGDRCRANDKVCDNSGKLATAGSLGIVGIIAAIAGQALLLAYVFLDGKCDMRKALIGSLVGFAFCWLFLVASWGSFATALNSQTQCKLMDESGLGAIIAKGSFGEIVEGSFSYHIVIISWVLTMPIMAIIGHKLATGLLKPARSALEAGEPRTQDV
eukprot:TRINITY_DN89854_c0_g1_i1.p1 TRINITY_DN89854_c0_g1~~TRINITY_DN89854_c0_g1_i1.p1  ORF type:complete len:862 (-),score=155.86 TRINITY_DN89854_c0_g1_i1:32-2572(-)